MRGKTENRMGAISALRVLHAGKVKRGVKRMLSLVLTVCMVLTGFPSIPTSLAAADDTIQDFDISVEDLKNAMEKAVRGATPISESAYSFTGAESDIYNELFYWNDVYELTDDVEIDTDGDLTLKIFMKEDGDQDFDSYSFTGDEQIIFLVLNGTNRDKTARIYIDGASSALINVSAKNAVNMEKLEVMEELPEIPEEAVEEAAWPEAEEAVEPETEPVIGPAGPIGGAGAGGPGGAGGAGAPPAGIGPAGDDIPMVDTPFEDAMGEVGPGVAGPGAGNDQGPAQGPVAGPGASDDGSYSNDEGSDASGSYDDGYTGSEDYDDGSGSGTDAGKESGGSSSEGGAADTGNDGSESGSDSGSESGSEGGSASEGGSSSDGSDSGSESSGSSSSDSGADSSDSGSSSGSESSSNDSSSNSGSESSGSSSSGSSSSDGGSSSSDSGSDGGSQTASISSHGVGILAAPLDEIMAGSDDGGSNVYVIPDIVIESEDASGSDGEYVVETEVRLASASDAYSDDDDDTSGSYEQIGGEVYNSVLVNRKKAGAAFVTTVESLGLRMSDVDRRPPVELEDQVISADIYRDSEYDWKFSDGTSITLSGMMPEDAVAKAYPVEVEIEDIHVLAAYDITIFDADGYEYQPEDDEIEVTIENDEISEALGLEHELTVFHMEDEDDEPEEIAVIEPAPKMKKVNFFAERFSIYVVGDSNNLEDLEGNPHYVYKLSFYIEDDSSQPISTQTVSPGEYVEMPSVPDRENYEFIGWFSEPNGGGDQYLDHYTNTMPEITGNEDVEINLYAHYVELYYVHYMTHEHGDSDNDESTRVVFHSEAYSPDENSKSILNTSEAEKLYLAEGYLSYIDNETGTLITALAVTGWKDEKDKLWATGDEIDWDVIDGDLLLYPIVEGAYWIYYDMNGHDSTENPAPEYVLATQETVGDLQEPKVSGYTFDGWYTAIEGGTKVISTTTLESLPKNTDGSITLYAHWTEAEVAYTINIWRQKATDGLTGIQNKNFRTGDSYNDYIGYYDYAESVTVSADDSQLKTGDKPEVSKVNEWSTYTGYGSITNTVIYPDYYGFEYAEERTLNDLNAIDEMNADGSTIINIFYDRVTITWTFSESSTAQGSSTGAETGTLIGLYGTNVDQGSDNAGSLSGWPDAGETTNSTRGTTIYRWYVQTSDTASTEFAYETEFIIINNSAETTFQNRIFNHNTYAYYYLEVTNESIQVDTSGAKSQEAAGYGVSYTKTVGDTPYVYDRRVAIPEMFPAEAESQYAGYTYAGYNTADDGTSLSTSFPQPNDSNEIYFLFNNANNYYVTLKSGDKVIGVTEGKPVETQESTTYTVKYGEELKNYIFPDRKDMTDAAGTFAPAYYYNFVGWYEDPSATAEFNQDITMPSNNLIAYANWELNKITVTFVTGDSNVEPPDDQTIKATEKATDPEQLGETLKREGYTHVGWIDQNGKVFNFDTVLYVDTTLTAIWKADDESGYVMEYDLNIDNSHGLLDNYVGATTSTNPEHFTVDEELWTLEKAFVDLDGQTNITGKFIGWNTATDGSGTYYYPGDDFTLNDASVIQGDKVTLYAIWALENESTLVLKHNYPDGYNRGTNDNTITQDNLTEINLAEESGLTYHTEIEVTDSSGETHTYRFDGWSTAIPANDPTDEDVDVAADAIVKVDTLGTDIDNVNYLYAVWVEVHEITVTKKVVNNAVGYKISDEELFAFNWSFDSNAGGETVTNTNYEEIIIKDGESFTIPDVASGESVTITEITQTFGDGHSFSTSYNGPQINVEDDGKGTCTFTMTASSQEITVTNTVDITELIVTKVWLDEDAGSSQKSIEVDAYEDGVKIGELELAYNDGDSSKSWTGSLEIAYDKNKKYTVKEPNVPDGYSCDVSDVAEVIDSESGELTNLSCTITNTKVADIAVTKEWDDDSNRDGIRPDSVTVALSATYTNGQILNYNGNLSASENWTYTWEDQPLYDSDRNKINYSISETSVTDKNGNTATYTANVTGNVEEGFILTNTHTPELINDNGEIKVTKIWSDDNNRDGIRPDTIDITLLANGSEVTTDAYGNELKISWTDKSNDTWTGTFKNLPKNADGDEITYTITEQTVDGYTSDGPTGTAESGFNITNTHVPGTISITVTKVWDDDSNRDGIRPKEIDVSLLANGTEVTKDEEGKELKINWTDNENDTWTGTFSNIPQYESGIEIAYTVSEKAVVGYSITYKTGDSNDSETCGTIVDSAVTITNSHPVELFNETGIITITKTWDDDNNRDGIRPDTINITLLANDSEVTTDAYGNELKINWTDNGEDTWTGTFENLPKKADGAEITYTITEQTVDGYTSDGPTGSAENGFTITNTHRPEKINTPNPDDPNDPDDKDIPDGADPGELPVTKVWDDYDDTFGIRPSEITVRLVAKADVDGESTEIELGNTIETELTLTADNAAEDDPNKWTGKFTGLPKYYNGQKIEYSVEEVVSEGDDSADNYKSTSSSMSGNGSVTLTNELNFDFSNMMDPTIEEEIVPNSDGESTPGSWISQESVNEYDAIQVEMSTTLPKIPVELLNRESDDDRDDFILTFFNKLDTGLILDTDENDFTVDIIDANGKSTTIDTDYYEITTGSSASPLSTLSVPDDPTFQVSINLTALYNNGEGVISDDDLGSSTIRVFFYEDLESTDVNRSYVSTAWYQVVYGDIEMFTSAPVTVEVWTSEILISKTAGDTGDPLPGAEFGLYYDEDCTNAVTRNGEAFTVVTDENGEGLLIGLANDTYYLKELEAPEGYNKVDNVTIVLNSSDTSGTVSGSVYTLSLADPPASSSSGGSGGSGHHSGGSGGGGGSTHSGVTTGSDTGPGVDGEGDGSSDGWSWSDLGYVQDENGNWVLPKTGDSNRLPAAMATGLTAALALIVLLWLRRRESSN